MNFRKELGIDTLNVVLDKVCGSILKTLDTRQKLARKNIKWAANDQWQFVNGWYDERKQSYRDVFLDVNTSKDKER